VTSLQVSSLCDVVTGKFILSVLVYIAEVVLQSGGRENRASAADVSDNSVQDGESMDVQELANDIDNVRMLLCFLVLFCLIFFLQYVPKHWLQSASLK